MSLERQARAYISAVEGGAAGADLARFYHADVVVEEYPNRLNPAGAQRGLPEVLAGAEALHRAFSRQICDIRTLTEQGDRVIVEMLWTGWLAQPLGLTKTGDTIRARICQVIEFEDGLIIRQRTYDCYEPF